MSQLLAGIDVGSSRIRTLIFDTGGAVIAEGSAPTPVVAVPGGGQDYPAEALWRTVGEATRAALAAAAGATGLDPAALARRVRGVAVASMGESAVPVDAGGRPLADAMVWFDERTQPDAEWLQREIGFDRMFRASGLRIERLYGLCKMLWLKRTRPEAMAWTKRWLNISDYVAWRLTGEAATDFSLASRMLTLDLAGRRWNAPLLETLGIDPAILPPLRPSGFALGRVTAAAAEATGLSTETVVGVGGHDHVIGAFAAGSFSPGCLLNSIGTAEAMIYTVDAPSRAPETAAQGYGQGAMEVDRPFFYLFGSIYAGAANIEWSRKALGATAITHEVLTAAAAAEPPGSRGALYVPHIRTSICPNPDPHARGAFLGLHDGVGQATLFRAVLEGMGLEARAVTDGMAALSGGPPSEIRLIGGGARSPLLAAIKAACYGRPVLVAQMPEATSLGAALLGGLAAGVYAGAAEAVAAIRTEWREVVPDPAWTALYQRIYETAYRPLYAALRPVNHAIAGLGLAGA